MRSLNWLGFRKVTWAYHRTQIWHRSSLASPARWTSGPMPREGVPPSTDSPWLPPHGLAVQDPAALNVLVLTWTMQTHFFGEEPRP